MRGKRWWRRRQPAAETPPTAPPTVEPATTAEPSPAAEPATSAEPATEAATVVPDAPPAEPVRWVVGARRRSREREWHGIEVPIDGHPLTVELRDHPAADRPEAVLTMLVPAALGAGARLVTDQAVDPAWAEGVEQASATMAGWWGHAPRSPVEAPLLPEAGRPHDAGDGPRRTAICFTGGVDSFWALLEGHHQPTHLLYIVGYDVPLHDRARIEAQVAAVDAVAEAQGLVPLILRTDLRTHALAGAADWERVHGAALAGAAMVASEEIDRLVVPPSYPDGRLIPWGSRPDLDPLWSVPGTLEVVHSATPLPRLGRVQAIAGNPLVHAHLRVCWEHRSPDANCGECEKCVRTMTQLATVGQLDAVRTLPSVEDLPDRIRALHPLPEHHLRMWRDLLSEPLPPAVTAAIATLVDDPRP